MNVLVTTKHRGVFCGQIAATQDLTQTAFPMKNARMAIYWGTTRGVMELAESGPTKSSKISAPADIPMLHDVTAVFQVTDEAWQKWQSK